jgi:hypothetical protein
MKEIFVLDNFDIKEILEKLSKHGATSLEILKKDFRILLLKEAQKYPYTEEKEYVGSGERIVRQQMATFRDFPSESLFIILRNSFQALLERHLANLEVYPFEVQLNFNSMVLQRYPKGSIGISPHRDGLSYINLICIFNLAGYGRFFICADRSGTESKEITSLPGWVILLKAPGLFGSKERPFHYVTDIRETRYVFGLRQKITYTTTTESSVP